ncbi:MAG: RAMP superfamily CRISPR-associated protein [Leptothrix ochracea]|uniref:RAMP superfamily CRISPR-associated protein n=1 Tax=Leptothrix ochracea TaxID=735331 RepID=UPI0034E1EEDF
MAATQRILSYRLSFNTPAFLGNAEQQAQWRTPPIKALLRQWWRVVKAPQVGYDHRCLLDAENRLFGAAGEEKKPWGQSKIRLRIEQGWDTGSFKPPTGDPITHDESPTKKVAANTYLGYGSIGVKNDRTALEPTTKLAKTLRLRILTDNEETTAEATDQVVQAIQLAAWFGGLGSRSRNGFGSMHWTSEGDTPTLHALTIEALRSVSRPLHTALLCDWPHAIGTDRGGLLIWQTTRTYPTWMAAMKALAVIKIGLRTSPFFKFHGGSKFGHREPLTRHVLAYPSGRNHQVDAKEWGAGGRMANQLRLRLHRDGQDGYRGVIVHVPCGVPAFMRQAVRHLPDERLVWETVHRFFDDCQELERLKA